MFQLNQLTFNLNQKHRLLIFGLGVTGYSILEWAMGLGWSAVVVDDQDSPPLLSRLKANYPDVIVDKTEQWASHLKGVDAIFVSPGISPKSDWVKAVKATGLPVMTDMDILAATCQSKIIAITGSNGKTTVSTMLASVLRASGKQVALVGNIGTPVLSALKQQTSPDIDYFIVEVSSFQLFWVNYFPVYCGVILNLYANHLDWHADFQCYWQSKRKIIEHSTVGIASDQLKQWSDLNSDPALSQIKHWISDCQSGHVDPSQMKWDDYYALESMQAVESIGHWLGCSDQAIETGLSLFEPWPYRCSRVYGQSLQGVWYNDAKSTNLAAAHFALVKLRQYHQKPVLWIAGGVSKQEDLSRMGKWHGLLARVVLFGRDAPLFLEALSPLVRKESLNVTVVKSLKEALSLTTFYIKPDDVVLFSPAAASFDQFRNFEHRGQTFNELCREISVS